MKQAAFSMRPGTLIGYQGHVWRVISNDTMTQQFRMKRLDAASITKTIRYVPGQEIECRWIPFSR